MVNVQFLRASFCQTPSVLAKATHTLLTRRESLSLSQNGQWMIVDFDTQRGPIVWSGEGMRKKSTDSCCVCLEAPQFKVRRRRRLIFPSLLRRASSSYVYGCHIITITTTQRPKVGETGPNRVCVLFIAYNRPLPIVSGHPKGGPPTNRNPSSKNLFWTDNIVWRPPYLKDPSSALNTQTESKTLVSFFRACHSFISYR